jgi:glycosyl transferase family 87
VAALVVAHAAFSVAPALFRIRNDFANYYVPAWAVAHGDRLDRAYERTFFPREAARAGLPPAGSFVPHPPANALLLLPLASLSPLAAKVVWTGLLALCGLFAFLALRPHLAVSPWMVALPFLLPSASWANALLYGQPYPLLLLLLALSLAAAMRERELLAGALLAPVALLKLYGLPWLAWFLWTRRFRAAAGMLAGLALFGALGLALLGGPVHEAWWRDVLPASLAGDVQDPYSTIWGSLSSLAHRLFQLEPDLNPYPLVDWPAAARLLSRGLPMAILVVAVWSAGRLARGAHLPSGGDPSPAAAARAYAILTLASLAASPLTASYHFVLLALPVAVLIALPEATRWRRALILGLLAFATSPLPHYFARFAHGAANVLAYPRLAAVIVLLALALPWPPRLREVLAAVVLGLVFASTGGVRPAPEEPWARVGEARGYLSAEPIDCGGRLTWATLSAEAVLRQDAAGVLQPEPLSGLRCREGRLVEAPVAAESVEPADADQASGGNRAVQVFVDSGSGELRLRDGEGALRTLDRGPLRHPRLSPDAAWIVYQAWEGSWNLRAVEWRTGRVLTVTADPANELEPSWAERGDAVLFASDRRRGLGSTALYRVPFRPRTESAGSGVSAPAAAYPR